jgi:predicted ribosome quality control (RQC) complex YloA/Tae2 family protein
MKSNMQIELSLKKSIDQNASVYFEAAKKAKLKLEGAKEALEASKKQLAKLESKSLAAEQKQAEAAKFRRSDREWYEKFRWFFSSTGRLVLLGRDATTNEILIKKHLEPDDMVFHAEEVKSPFCIVKGGLDEPTMVQAADATASFSEAWKRGLSSVEVFYVMPDQVTKQAKAGEFVSKGSFMIYGKKHHLKGSLSLALGIDKHNRIVAGPGAAVRASCPLSVELFPGSKKASDIAKIVQKRLGPVPLDDIIRVLPSGGMSLS